MFEDHEAPDGDEEEQTAEEGSEEEGASGEDESSEEQGGSKGPKMVRESDLLRVKNRLKKTEDALETAKGEAAAWQDRAQSFKADLDTANSSLEELKTVQTELDELKTKSEGDSKLLEEYQERILGYTRTRLKSEFDVSDDVLEGKSQSQLDDLLETLGDIAPENEEGRKLRFDRGGGSTRRQVTETAGESAIATAKKELAALRPK